jgi:Asparagine synthase
MLEAREHTDDLAATASKVRELLADIVHRQTVADVPLCSLLSGGLDSSVVSALAADSLMRRDRTKLATFSVDFAGSADAFTPDQFRPSHDEPFARAAVEHIGSRHGTVMLSADDLVEAQWAPLAAHDLPTMGDMWVSMYLLSHEIRQQSTVALSGESADEVFGGYACYHVPALLAAPTFPWAFRGSWAPLLTPSVRSAIRLDEYAADRYAQAVAEVPRLAGDSPDDRIKLFHQNDPDGTQNGSWTASPGETVGPMMVLFETGWGSYGILDWWSVVIAVDGGSTPGIYQNSGTTPFPHWKECQLQSGDVDQNLTFAVSAGSFDINLASGGCTDGMTRLGEFSKITNVFVLMLENRSFDNLFGQSGIPGITHATPADSNAYHDVTYPVGSPAPTAMPTDPGHEFQDVVKQLGGPDASYPSGGPYPTINLSGFAANYATTTTSPTRTAASSTRCRGPGSPGGSTTTTRMPTATTRRTAPSSARSRKYRR